MANETHNTPDEVEENGGLTAAEQAEFDAMQAATSGDAGGSEAADPDAGGADDAGAAAAAAAAAAAGGDDAAKAVVGGAAADGDPAKPAARAKGVADADAGAESGDDDEDEEGDGEADPNAKPGADGQPRRKKGRVSAKKYETAEAERVRLAGELQVSNERNARFDERFKILSEALTTPKGGKETAEDDDPKPDKEADAFAFMEWQDRQIEKLSKRLDGVQQGTQQREASNDLATTYELDAKTFDQKDPNFGLAYGHLIKTRFGQLALFRFGLDLTEDGAKLTAQQVAAINRDIAAEEQGIVADALKKGVSPALAVYRMAKATGYTPKPAEEAAAIRAAFAAQARGEKPAVDAKPAGNGKAAAAKPAANGKVDVAAEIKRIQAGSEAALSLSDGGGAPPAPLTPQKLADMSDEEFNRLADSISPEEWQMLVEGQA